jgi:hypothetical protein
MTMASYFVLPATEPGDATYGATPDSLPGVADPVHAIRFEHEVWYNAGIRADVVRQVRASAPVGRRVGIGFSKSGLGVLGVSLDVPDLFDAILVFDAPLTLRLQPPWNTAAFYDQESWEQDLPILHLDRVRRLLARVRLVHVAGRNFVAQHDEFHAALAMGGSHYVYHRAEELAHHWNSGWLDRYLPELA